MVYLIFGLILGAILCMVIIHISNSWNRWKFFKGQRRRMK
jgi:hypothetical protein